MENRFNKPRVFLSHASKNKPFIKRIADDLRACQIECWLDEYEIRDGRPWLKMIFEDGIPTCDAVLVYLTKEALDSKMVERELDAAVVHQLTEGRVNLLPYVSDATIRAQLRSDLQTLHIREWNHDNYLRILPTVVAEIWRSYFERMIEGALLQEKNRRLEQELENKRLLEQVESSVFSAREDQEFQYLHRQLSKKVDVKFSLFKDYRNDGPRRKIGTEVCRVSILRMLLGVMESGAVYFNAADLGFYLARALDKTFLTDGHEVTRSDPLGTIEPDVTTRIQNDIQTYGLTRITSGEWGISYEITDKMYRFRFWLEYNGILVDEPLDHVVTLNLEEPQSPEEQTDEGRITAQALAVDARIQQARIRKAWSTSGEGTLAVIGDIQRIFDNLKDRVSKSNEVFENIKLQFDSDSDRFSLTTGDVTLTLEGSCPTQNTEDCLMRLSVTAKKREAGSESLTVEQQIFLRGFKVKVDKSLELKWTSEGRETWSTPKLADYCWSTFMQLIQQHEERG